MRRLPQIDRGQGSVPMKMQFFGTACPAMFKSRVLLGIPEDEFYLEALSVIIQ